MDRDLGDARKHGEIAVSIARTTGASIAVTLCEMELATVLLDSGRREEACRHLLLAATSATGGGYLEFLCKLHGARFAYESGREEEGLGSLREAMCLGSRQGYLNVPRWDASVMSPLCARALEHGIEPEYVRRLIRVHALAPPVAATGVEAWPWPVRIRTLGQLEIVTDETPLAFSGKVQKKPLELLKLLIALGGVNVPEDQLAAALWPDADGDLAHRSFDTTLYRLRLLIGNDKALRLREGLLTLDARHCWVDVWDFERLAQQFAAGGGAATLELAQKAIGMYHGHFLPADDGQPWSAPARERLRKRLTTLIVGVGSGWQAAGCWEKALACFERGLELDDAVEAYYQHVMVCHLELGQPSEAASTYDRCRAAMGRVFGLAPSARTEALRAAVTARGS
jgi:LuxR family transcriptional regulator, maltose regulon positive regulatory protein